MSLVTRRADGGGGLELRHVEQSFGGMVAVKDLSVCVEPAEIFGIIGPNGAGKTTVLNCISRVNRRYKGAVLFDGQVITCPPHEVARRGIARTFQSAEAFSDFTVANALQLSRFMRQRKSLAASAVWMPWIRRDEARERAFVLDLLERFGFADLADVHLSAVPYGTRKILDILRALASEPKVLLLDEPTSGVASADRSLIASLLREVNDSAGTTVVVVDHDVSFIAGLSDRLLAMSYGELLGVGAPNAVLAQDTVIESYIGHATTSGEAS